MTSDFCRQCGCTFPPIEGEGACKYWETCQQQQDDIVYRLRKRAEIRRKIDRGDGKPDRIANICEEAADEIEKLRKALVRG